MARSELGNMLAACGFGLFSGTAVGYASHSSGVVALLVAIVGIVLIFVGILVRRRAARPVLVIHREGGSPQLTTYYLTVRNRSSSEIRVTRIWMDNCDPEVAKIYNQGLPKVIGPLGSLEVKAQTYQPQTPEDWAERGHALLSDGTELLSAPE